MAYFKSTKYTSGIVTINEPVALKRKKTRSSKAAADKSGRVGTGAKSKSLVFRRMFLYFDLLPCDNNYSSTQSDKNPVRLIHKP